jgi:phytoene desaturase
MAPRANEYDVVVVGAGIGGLSAAAFLAKAGKRVLLVDRLDGPGGLAHAFKRQEYVFDPAIHITTGFEDGEIGDVLLRTLGVRERVQLIKLPHPYGALYPDAQLLADSGEQALIESYGRVLPAHAREIRAFFELCDAILRESLQVGFRASVSDMDELLRRFPTFFAYRNAVAADVLREMVADERARSLCLSIWPYMAVAPERLPMTQLSSYLIALGSRPVCCAGGFQQLANAFACAAQDNGAELCYATTASAIAVENGKVTGVRLDDEHNVRTSAVVSNADGRQTFADLIGRERVPASVLRRLDRLQPSLSAFVVFTASTLDLTQLGLGHETFVFSDWDHGKAYRDAGAGEPSSIWITTPSTLDPSLAPPGVSIVTISMPVAYDIGEDWSQAAPRLTELILDRVDRIMPGFRDSLLYVESATPRSIESLTLGQGGALYGWELSLAQLATKRLRQETPIGGLYLAGHWSEHGAGAFRVMLSGASAAQKILGYRDLGAMIDGLG